MHDDDTLYLHYQAQAPITAMGSDGNLLAVASRSVIELLETTERAILASLWDPSPVERVALSLGSDSRLIAVARRAQGIHIIERMTGKRLLTYLCHRGQVQALAFSPDGRDVASVSMPQLGRGGHAIIASTTTSKRCRIHIWDARTGDVVMLYRGHDQGVRCLAWSPDGAFIASGGDDNQILVWRVLTAECIARYRGHRHTVTGVAWSPDGRYLASVSLDQTVQIWSPWQPPHEEQPGEIYEQPRTKQGELLTVAWSPDGRHIATGGPRGQVHIIDWDAQYLIPCAHSHQEAVTAVAWSRDSQQLFSASRDQTIRRWPVPQVVAASGL